MRELLIATKNPGKLKELQELLRPLGIGVLSLAELPPMPDIIEDGDSFAANAVKKARETSRHTGYITMADDSGLIVDALNGLPGINSARFAGDNASDADNNGKLLELLAGVEQGKRTARFVCVIAIGDKNGKVVTVEGRCEGRIDVAPKGSAGFGYDPLFIPTGHQISFAQLSSQEKHKISHRGQALNQAIPLIKQFFVEE